MERRQLLPMVLAVGAALFYLGVLSAKERALVGQHEYVKVLVARVDLPERTLLDKSHFSIEEIPRRWVAQDAVDDLSMAVNLVTRVRIPRGNQLSQSLLMPSGGEAGLAVRVPPGYRGAVLSVDPAMKPHLKPGDRVDVLVTFDALMSDGKREKVTATILQNVLVLAVGVEAKDDKRPVLDDRPAISVAVNPAELQYLALAQRQGETAVGVRAAGDRIMSPIPMASMSGLFK